MSTACCAVCGRLLQSETSRRRMVGPKCAKATRAHTAPHTTPTTTRRPEPANNQPTLWSL